MRGISHFSATGSFPNIRVTIILDYVVLKHSSHRSTLGSMMRHGRFGKCVPRRSKPERLLARADREAEFPLNRDGGIRKEAVTA